MNGNRTLPRAYFWHIQINEINQSIVRLPTTIANFDAKNVKNLMNNSIWANEFSSGWTLFWTYFIPNVRFNSLAKMHQQQILSKTFN